MPDKLPPVLAEHFSCPLPLLDDLTIDFQGHQLPTLPENLFDGDLSSLRKLTLVGVIIPLPWRDLSNLTTFKFNDVHEDKILLNQLLDFLESAPYLRHIRLRGSLPSSSNAPTERAISLPHLKVLDIIAKQPCSILLNHLSIPAGASPCLEFKFDDEHFPISSHLPKSPGSLPNLSHITAVNFCFSLDRRRIRLNGPSGELYILGYWTGSRADLNTGASRMIQYLTRLDISRVRWLAITVCSYRSYNSVQIQESIVYETLNHMEDLRTLMLIRCESHPWIRALNPDKTVLCPRLEEIVFYTDDRDPLHVDELMKMAKERALRGAKLSAITVVSIDAVAPKKEVFQLRQHVSRVEYKFDDALPEWDALPG